MAEDHTRPGRQGTSGDTSDDGPMTVKDAMFMTGALIAVGSIGATAEGGVPFVDAVAVSSSMAVAGWAVYGVVKAGDRLSERLGGARDRDTRQRLTLMPQRSVRPTPASSSPSSPAGVVTRFLVSWIRRALLWVRLDSIAARAFRLIAYGWAGAMVSQQLAFHQAGVHLYGVKDREDLNGFTVFYSLLTAVFVLATWLAEAGKQRERREALVAGSTSHAVQDQ